LKLSSSVHYFCHHKKKAKNNEQMSLISKLDLNMKHQTTLYRGRIYMDEFPAGNFRSSVEKNWSFRFILQKKKSFGGRGQKMCFQKLKEGIYGGVESPKSRVPGTFQPKVSYAWVNLDMFIP